MSIALEPLPFPPYRELGNDELNTRISAAKRELGSRLLILGHHYQQDEVIAHADLNGDSYQLSKMAARALLLSPSYSLPGCTGLPGCPIRLGHKATCLKAMMTTVA